MVEFMKSEIQRATAGHGISGLSYRNKLVVQNGIENLSVAVSLIADTIGNTVMENRLRDYSFSALEEISQTEVRLNNVRRVKDALANLRSLLRSGYRSGVVTADNYHLVDEYIKGLFESLSSVPASMDVSTALRPVEIDPHDNPDASVLGKSFKVDEMLADELPSIDFRMKEENENSQPIKVDDFELGDRHKEIIQHLTINKDASLAEIADLFSDVSFRTVQRDMNVLLDMGLVGREGDRRWARYFVKKS